MTVHHTVRGRSEEGSGPKIARLDDGVRVADDDNNC